MNDSCEMRMITFHFTSFGMRLLRSMWHVACAIAALFVGGCNEPPIVDTQLHEEYLRCVDVCDVQCIMRIVQESREELELAMLREDVGSHVGSPRFCHPLILAAMCGSDVVRSLLTHEDWLPAVVDPCNRETIAAIGVRIGDGELIQMYIDSGGDINSATEAGCLLSIAISAGKHEIVRQLIDFGVKVTCDTGPSGDTPLHAAADITWRRGQYNESIEREEASFRLLLARGADPNARNLRGVTPLMISASSGCVRCFELLLDAGATIEHVDNRGRTLLHHAIFGPDARIVDYLIRNGVDYRVADAEGFRPVHVAVCASPSKAVVLRLLEEEQEGILDEFTSFACGRQMTVRDAIINRDDIAMNEVESVFSKSSHRDN